MRKTKPPQTTPAPMHPDPLPPLLASLPEDLRQGMTSLIRIFGLAATVSPFDRVMTLEDTDELRRALPLED